MLMPFRTKLLPAFERFRCGRCVQNAFSYQSIAADSMTVRSFQDFLAMLGYEKNKRWLYRITSIASASQRPLPAQQRAKQMRDYQSVVSTSRILW